MAKKPEKNAHQFYKDSLELLHASGIPFMVGGTYAFMHYTGIVRPTKDLDIFCRGGDYEHILSVLKDKGENVQILDARWLAKVVRGKYRVDIIFSCRTDQIPIDDTWLMNAKIAPLFGIQVKMLPVEEMIWSKAFVQHRDKYDGPDVNHLLLKYARVLDWQRLLMRLNSHWEVLFSHLMNFRFVYPSERDTIPKWVMEELLKRISEQLSLPTPKEKISRGHLLTDKQYEIDREWGYEQINSSS